MPKNKKTLAGWLVSTKKPYFRCCVSKFVHWDCFIQSHQLYVRERWTNPLLEPSSGPTVVRGRLDFETHSIRVSSTAASSSACRASACKAGSVTSAKAGAKAGCDAANASKTSPTRRRKALNSRVKSKISCCMRCRCPWRHPMISMSSVGGSRWISRCVDARRATAISKLEQMITSAGVSDHGFEHRPVADHEVGSFGSDHRFVPVDPKIIHLLQCWLQSHVVQSHQWICKLDTIASMPIMPQRLSRWLIVSPFGDFLKYGYL